MVKDKEDKFLHGDLSALIIKAYYKVYNTLRVGFLEKVYEKALMLELKENMVPAEQLVPIKVFYNKQPVGDYFADIVADKKIIVEIKAVQSLKNEHEAQILNYLKATEMEVGLLLNFGRKAEFRRVAFSNINK